MIKNARTMIWLLAGWGMGAACMACGSSGPSEMGTASADGAAIFDGSLSADGGAQTDAAEATDGTASAEDAALVDGAALADGATQGDAAAQGDGQCLRSQALADAGPMVTACTVGNAFVECTFDGGASCECISDDPTTCAGCGLADAGATCRSMCASNQYAISCGGSSGGSFQAAPSGCVGSASSPEGSEYYCCPCQ